MEPKHRLSPEELLDLSQDPRMQDARIRQLVLSKLDPADRALLAPPAPEGSQSLLGDHPGTDLVNGINDVITGGVKGAASTIHNLPLLGRGANAAGNALANALGAPGRDVSYEEAGKAMEPANTAEGLGKGAEQVGEFLLPAGAARKTAISGLARMIPDAASPETMRVLNKVATQGGRILGEAGSATGVAAAHGDEHPLRAGAIAGVGAPASELLAGAVPFATHAAPYVAGGLAMKELGGGLGLVGGFGLGALIRKMVSDALVKNPSMIPTMQQGVRRVTPYITRLLAGAESESDKP